MTVREKLIKNLGKEVEIITEKHRVKAKINWVSQHYISITLTKGDIILRIKNIKEIC